MTTLRFLILFVLAVPALSQSLVRVPTDTPDLQQAVIMVANGGAIEIAAGTYDTPQQGLQLGNLQKSFTIRAAPGARVVFDGRDAGPVVRFENSDPSRGRKIAFERIVFTRGSSTQGVVAGGVTVREAEASFEQCEWIENTATQNGGGLAVIYSTVHVHDGVFLDNRVNPPGHHPESAGGGVYVLDATVRISGSRFERNEAGFTGGAVYAFGNWGSEPSVPVADVSIVGSTFLDNTLRSDPCCPAPAELAGGAVHAENQATVRIHNSRFERNTAETGGAIDNYRARVEIHGSVFRDNRTLPADGSPGLGGTIFSASSDFGEPDERNAELYVSNSLIEGTEGVVTGHNGACLTVVGDTNRRYGENGQPATGTAEQHRAVAQLDGVVFLHCTGSRIAGKAGLGGAVHASLADLRLENSLVLGSEIRGENAAGGGLAVLRESTVRIIDSGFAGNVAERFGGAIYSNGSHLEVEGCSFHDNVVRPGVSPPIFESDGAAILSQPNRNTAPRDATGFVRGSLFTGNTGVPIRELDYQDGQVNRMVYDNNRFTDSNFGTEVFLNNLVDFTGTTVAQLNSLVVNRSGASSTDKSNSANQRLGFPPLEGRLIAAPPSFAPTGGGHEGAELGYSWTGSGTVTVGGSPVAGKWGTVPATAAGESTLRVGGTALATATVGSGYCAGSSLGLCLQDERFFVGAEWEDFQARRGTGQAETLSADTGYFWFFDEANVEAVIKVLDGTPLNEHFWVFYGALSNVEYALTVTDLASGRISSYRNPAGRFASVGDSEAFPESGVVVRQTQEPRPELRGQGSCVGTATDLCLRGDRFRLRVTWRDFQGGTGAGQAVSLTSDTGYFWFFSDTNVELIAKVLDGTPINGHFWVFYGALSNVGYTLTVTDTETGQQTSYTNPPGQFASVGDTEALAESP